MNSVNEDWSEIVKKCIKLKMMHTEWYYLYTLKKTQKGCMAFIGTYINYKTGTGMIHILNLESRYVSWNK